MVRIVVAGAGAAGASVAYHLAELGARQVVLCDRGPVAGGATAKAMGGVRQQFSTEAEVKLAQASIRFFEQLGSPLFDQVGYLFLATTEAGLAELEQRAELQRSLGVPVEAASAPAGVRADDVVGAEERTACPQLAGAGTNGAGARRREVRAPHLVLHRLAVERAGARSTLVEDHDAVLAPLGRECAGEEAAEEREAGLPRSTREHEQHAVGRVHVVAHADLQMQRPPCEIRTIERNVERGAGEPADAGTGVGAVQTGRASRRGPGHREGGGDEQDEHPNPHCCYGRTSGPVVSERLQLA